MKLSCWEKKKSIFFQSSNSGLTILSFGRLVFKKETNYILCSAYFGDFNLRFSTAIGKSNSLIRSFHNYLNFETDCRQMCLTLDTFFSYKIQVELTKWEKIDCLIFKSIPLDGEYALHCWNTVLFYSNMATSSPIFYSNFVRIVTFYAAFSS